MKKDGSLKDYIEKLTTPIYNRVLQEGLSNSITPPTHTHKYFFRPNNWRRQIEVKEKTGSTINYLLKTFPTLGFNSQNKLINLRKDNIVIQYGRNTLTAIYSCPIFKGVKKGWNIERLTIDEITNRIDQIKEKIRKELDDTLIQISRQFGVVLPFQTPIWGRHEDFIRGESYIDSIPRECQFIDTVCKKVYPEGIEFTGGKGDEPTLKVKTYLKNQSLKDHSPEIADSINALGQTVQDILTPPIHSLNFNLNTHISVLKGIDKSFKRFNKLLQQRSLNKWL